MKTAKRITNVLAVVVSAMMLGVGSVHAASLGSSTFTSFDGTAGLDIDVTGSSVVDWGYYDDQGDFWLGQPVDNSKAVSGIGAVSVVTGVVSSAGAYNPNLTMTFDDGAGPAAGTVAIGAGFGAWAPDEDNAATFTFNDLGDGTHTVRVYVGHSALNRIFDMDYTVTASDGNLSDNTVSSALGSGNLHATYELVFSTTDTSADLVLTFNSTSGDSGAGWIAGYVVETTGSSPSVELSSSSVASNAPPGTLVGTLRDPSGAGDTFVLTNGVGNVDNAKFQITDGTNLRTTVWMSQYSNSVSIAGLGSGTALVTNSVSIYVEAPTNMVFLVSATVGNNPSNGDEVGLMQAANKDATFTIVGGRTDLFTKDGSNNLLVTNETSSAWDVATNYVTLRATSSAGTSDLVVCVTKGGPSGTVFMFR
ncbi:MAG: hypothetical protein HN919_03600 [Verrucomicrobia bacterium]|jgi:hypothetical protein|nr:hypothetical protein [Verrucomicrobiota bacterium]MBT7702141.1 hypothetical protein [Verrucomicrobiota bacterium]